MSVHPHELAILEGKRRVRYLKLIALFKILKGALLFALGFSLLFLHARPELARRKLAALPDLRARRARRFLLLLLGGRTSHGEDGKKGEHGAHGSNLTPL